MSAQAQMQPDPQSGPHAQAVADLRPDALAQLRSELAQARQQISDMAAAQEDFLRGVSHDLRAPLRHVTSFGALVREVLQEQPPQLDEALAMLATMEQSARRMGQMIDGLQAIARARRVALRSQATDLTAAVQQARAALGSAADRVRWSIPSDMPAVQADAELLGQLLAQLLGNAVKFSRGAAQPCVHVRAQPAAPGRVQITVQDNGAGFDGARAQQLFGVFQRMHRESEFEGVGAGLALCLAIAQRHGATVQAQAALGAGCTVTLNWPASDEP